MLIAHEIKTEGVRKRYGCAMVPLSPEDAAATIEWAKANLDADEFSFDEDGDGGIETSPHVTVLYGLDGVTGADVQRVLGDATAPEATIGPLSLFKTAEYDVLKYSVYSDDLKALNSKLKELPFVATHPEYIPHVTVAYLKSGAGDRFVGQEGALTGKRLAFDTMLFSDEEKNPTYIPMSRNAAKGASPKRQFKSIELRELKALADGAGGFLGYPSKFYDIDSYGDIMLPGAYTDTIPSFLKDGFVTHSHDWEASATIGYPVSAVEDGIGLLSEMHFHSTEDAQSIRTKANERLAAGKTVKLSIGYNTEDAEIVYPDAYQSVLPKYIPASKLDAVLKQAMHFSCIRLLKRVNLFEYSIVTAPALRSADVLGVKSGEGSADELSFTEHLEAAADAISDIVRRTKAKIELRGKSGRGLSAPTREQVKTIHDKLPELVSGLGSLLTEVEPPKPVDVAQTKQALNREILRFETRRRAA